MAVRRLARIFANPATIALGVLGILGGLRALFDPASSPVALEWPRAVSLAWGVLYMSGGFGMLFGTISHRANIEASGWTAFAGGAALSALATVGLLGTNNLLSVYSIAVLAALSVCGFVKAHLLRAGYRLVWVAPTGEDTPSG